MSEKKQIDNASYVIWAEPNKNGWPEDQYGFVIIKEQKIIHSADGFLSKAATAVALELVLQQLLAEFSTSGAGSSP